MKFWKRQATLQIGSKRFGMDDLYFKFTVPFEDSEKLGTATIEAYNLSPATRNSMPFLSVHLCRHLTRCLDCRTTAL